MSFFEKLLSKRGSSDKLLTKQQQAKKRQQQQQVKKRQQQQQVKKYQQQQAKKLQQQQKLNKQLIQKFEPIMNNPNYYRIRKDRCLVDGSFDPEASIDCRYALLVDTYKWYNPNTADYYRLSTRQKKQILSFINNSDEQNTARLYENKRRSHLDY